MHRHCLFLIVALGLVPRTAQADEMTFHIASSGGNCSTCVWVAADGEITSKTPNDFQNFVAEHGPVRNLVINSPGGDLMAGVELGRMFRQQGVNTIVGRTVTGSYSEIGEGFCFSACSYAFFGGADRHVNTGGIGVHQFRAGDLEEVSSSETQTIVGVLIDYLTVMGVSPEALVAANLTNPGEIYTYSAEELEYFNIDNTTPETDDGWFFGFLSPTQRAVNRGNSKVDPHWALTPYEDGLMLTGAVVLGTSRALSLAIFCRRGKTNASLLVQEQGEVSAGTVSFRATSPSLTVADVNYDFSEQDIDFQGMDRGRAIISLDIPVEALFLGDESEFHFNPNLIQANYPLLIIGGILPQRSLVEAALKNCI
jgi:hypothetical protein